MSVSATKVSERSIHLNQAPSKSTESNIGTVQNLQYLGSTVEDNVKLDSEILLILGNASAVCANLRSRLWNNHHVPIKVKCQVYRATMLATLLYGAGTQVVYCVQADRL